MMNQVVEFERVDLASIKLGEANSDILEQRSQLRLVIAGDQLSRGTAIRLGVRKTLRVSRRRHRHDATTATPSSGWRSQPPRPCAAARRPPSAPRTWSAADRTSA